MTTGDTEIVSALRAAIEQRIGRKRFDLWFGSNTLLHPQPGSLAVVAPSQFFLDWLRRNFRADIEAASQQVLGEILPITFGLHDVPPANACTDANGVLLAAPPAHPVSANLHSTSERRRSRVVDRGGPESNGKNLDKDEGESRDSAGEIWKPSLDNFVVGDCNRLAHTSAEMIIASPGRYNPLFIWGPSACGKTHLLEGMVSRFRNTRRAAAVCLTAEKFTIEFLDALHGGGLPSFRHKHRGLELLAIDDAQFFTGKKHTVAELFHTIDTAVRSGKQLVITADRPPAELAGIGPELASRLQSGLVCAMEPPTLEVREGILAGLGERFSLPLPDEVKQKLASQITTHARQLEGAIKLLKAASRARRCTVTSELAEELLGDLLRPVRGVRLQDIESAVCDAFGIDASTLQSSRRHKDVSQPRMLAMWLARKHTRAALSEIGQYFGKRSHSTVVSAQRRIERSVAEKESFRLASRSLTAEEAIRLVEAKLRRA